MTQTWIGKPLVESMKWYVDHNKFNEDTCVWVVHLGKPPRFGMSKVYGYEKFEQDDFFSNFMDMSLTHRIEEMSFDIIEGTGVVNFVNFYLRELEPGEDTNIDGELLAEIAKGWEKGG